MFSTFLPERILITLGPIAIHWYGLFAAVGAVAAYLVGLRLSRWAKLSGETFGDLYFSALIAGIVGARLWHVVGDWGYYARHWTEIPALWNGGLAFHGGLVVGGLALVLTARRRNVPVTLAADIFAPLLAGAEAIGRWGNYFNQELFGRPTTLPWGIPIAVANRPDAYASATRFHPTFLYEFLGLASITLLLIFLFRRQRHTAVDCPPLFQTGNLLALFLILSGALRVGMEFFRIDPVLTAGGVRVPLLVSFLVIISGLFILRRQTLAPRTAPPTP